MFRCGLLTLVRFDGSNVFEFVVLFRYIVGCGVCAPHERHADDSSCMKLCGCQRGGNRHTADPLASAE